MINNRDRRCGQLFDRWEFLGVQRRRLLDSGWAGAFRKHLLNQLPIGDVAVHFHSDFGRPTKDLHIAIGGLILQQLHDLTDQQTVEAVAFNIAWHYALDIHHDVDAYLCPRTLRNYRRKIIEKQLETVIFRTLTDQLVKAFGVDTNKQRLDSTANRF